MSRLDLKIFLSSLGDVSDERALALVIHVTMVNPSAVFTGGRLV